MYYPVFIDLRGRPVLVVGGGAVAERKVESLLEAGATITVVSPDATGKLIESAERGEFVLNRRPFRESDLDGITLVISATDDVSVQQNVAALARSKKVLVNTADQPELCDFIVPAIVRRGDVLVAVSTSGTSPALAAALKSRIDAALTGDVARAAKLLGVIRGEVHQRWEDSAQRKKVFQGIVESGVVDWIAECDDDAALARVREIMDKLA
jgi:precorrin-2 dehydrogenase/sirohydrochlorin ferrochelatase